ncbi:hypothetical protein CC80DRAFT_246243 [Byssothecium circinans]|uniref:Uncharacterized protein n=1 Tax=Byssothecium circinans TaxID=147558 RepID=A0A6A5TCZ7_9PLEO|nr:hypothetical protein CC80DRAFT_246243 [Byssothecium circinans]
MSSSPSITHSTPPRLHTLVLFPSIPKRIQWDILHSYLDKSAPDASPAANQNHAWLENVEISILHMLLAKKRTEMDLLRSEMAYSSLASTATFKCKKRGSCLKFPNYEVGTYTPSHTTPLPLPPLYPGTRNRSTSVSNCDTHSYSHSDSAFNAAYKTTITDLPISKHSPFSRVPSFNTSDERSHLPSPVSPLSPTFGPRRGLIPSGTVARRCSSIPFNECIPDNQAPGSAENAAGALADTTAPVSTDDITPALNINGALGSEINPLKERRVLWEAAWKEIEAHFEEYVGRFGNGCDGEGKEGLWRLLVECGEERRGLERARGCGV